MWRLRNNLDYNKLHLAIGQANDSIEFMPDNGVEVISLEKHVITTKRFRERHETFSTLNAHINNYNWVYGIDAKEYPDLSLIQAEFPDAIQPNIPWRSSIICNALSHYSLIKECAKGEKIFTIMEDDAVLVEDFDSRATKLIHSLPDSDFDLIQWGWNWDVFVFIRNEMGIEKINWSARYLKEDPLDFKSTKRDSVLYPLLHTFGSHCYSLTPRGAQKILDIMPVIQDLWVDNRDLTGIAYRAETIDGTFNDFYPKMKAFIAIAPLSFVKNDKSESVL